MEWVPIDVALHVERRLSSIARDAEGHLALCETGPLVSVGTFEVLGVRVVYELDELSREVTVMSLRRTGA